MQKTLISFVFILIQSASYAQSKLLSKKPIDLKTTSYWQAISKNDTLTKEYSFPHLSRVCNACLFIIKH